MTRAVVEAGLLVLSLLLLCVTVDRQMVKAYDRGVAAGMQAAKQQTSLRDNMDHQCTAWFFNTNLRAAKQRMCGTRG